ncbi:MAG: Ger(x)C family spore germination protein [Caldicoprobacterales bacterium]|jgi:Ger(x)C family germination protein
MLKKCVVVCILLFLLLATTSCWDHLEIERQAFILGLAMDKAENGQEIEVTFQIAKPQAFTGDANADDPFWNTTQISVDMTEAYKQLTKAINQIPTLEHCQVILIGEELARGGLEENFDYLFRTHEIRRLVRIGVVQGKAKDVLDMEFQTDLLPAFVLSEMMEENSKHSLEVTDFMNIGKLHTADATGNDFVLSRVVPLDNKILDMSGAGVFQDLKLIGWLSGKELTGIRFIRGDVGSGYLALQLPEDLGKRAMLEIFETNSIMEPEIRDNRLYVHLELRIEGDIIEIIKQNEEIAEMEFLKRLEQLYEQDIKNKIQKSFQKMQIEFNSDPFLLKEKVKSYYPEFWKQNHEMWDEIYRSAILETEARVLIRRIGEIRH